MLVPSGAGELTEAILVGGGWRLLRLDQSRLAMATVKGLINQATTESGGEK